LKAATREFKNREVAQPLKQCNYWFHKKSRFEHTHIFMDAIATGRLEWCTAVCSLVLIAILLFLFIIFVNVVLSQRWGVVCGLRLFERKPGVGFFSVPKQQMR